MTDKIHQTLGDQGACPPPLGSAATPGCNLTFFEVVNGVIPCSDGTDCPQSHEWWEEACNIADNPTIGTCENRQCKFTSTNCGYFAPCFNSEDNLIIRGGSNIQYTCHVNQDCYVEDFTPAFNRQISMKCKSKQCISETKAKWNSIPFNESGGRVMKRIHKYLDELLIFK